MLLGVSINANVLVKKKNDGGEVNAKWIAESKLIKICTCLQLTHLNPLKSPMFKMEHWPEMI